MSEYSPKTTPPRQPDLRRIIALPEPDEGYRWSAEPKVSFSTEKGIHGKCYEYVQEPIAKYLDWSKVGPNVLVNDFDDAQTPMHRAHDPKNFLRDLWQAHIGGAPCPVDPDAVLVEYRRMKETFGPAKAGNVGWDLDTVFRVVGLVEGYQYP